MRHLQKVLLLSLVVLLCSCVTQTEVAVKDNSIIGNKNVHFIIEDDFYEDELGAGDILVQAFQEHGFSAELKQVGDVTIEGQSSGSGFVVADGYWLTNHHVIENMKTVTVSVNGHDYPAKVVAKDAGLDLALLKASTGNLPPFKLAHPKMGQEVYAIGFPLTDLLGEQARVTTGIVSSMHGYQGTTQDIQISAPIQPGNSGGPVVTNDWELIGVAVSSASTVSNTNRLGVIPQGLNFAVSGNHVKGFLLQNNVPLSSGEYVNNLEQAVASTGFIWSGSKASQKRIYFLDLGYKYYWDLGPHITNINSQIFDAKTGEVVFQSKTKSMRTMGVKLPLKEAVKDMLQGLGLIQK